jgi:serine recombinase
MRDVGLARVSTRDQNPQLQINALEQARCWPIYEERVSGVARSRPIREQVLAELSAGDTLTVWKLDRLGRSVIELEKIINDLRDRNITFRSLTNQIDTATKEGRFFFHQLAAFAEFERDMIIERTLEGKAAARAAGKPPGGHRLFGFPDNDVSEAQAKREADLLRVAAQHMLNGGTLRQLCDRWNSERVPTKTGKGRWTVTSIRRMLVNPRMVPILGEQTHHELVRLFANPQQRRKQGAPAVHLLSGILQCGICEQPMYVMVGGDGHVDYRCRPDSTRINRPACGGISISKQSADHWLTEAVIDAVCDPDFTDRLNIRRAALLESGATGEQLEEWGAEISDLETVLTTRFGTDKHKARHDELQRRVRLATRQLLARPDLQVLMDLPKTKKKLRTSWASWDVTRRRRVLKALLRSVKVKPSGRTGRRFNPDRLDPDWRIYRSSPNRVTARLSAEPLWSKGTREEPLVTSLREVL